MSLILVIFLMLSFFLFRLTFWVVIFFSILQPAWYFTLKGNDLFVNLINSFIIFGSSFVFQECIILFILNRSLNWSISSSIASTFLLEKSRHSMVAYFLIDLPLILPHLSKGTPHFHVTPFPVSFLDLVPLPSPPFGFTTSRAIFWFTHF